MTDELDRLNAAERRILTLLAQGHTAKSIAAIDGCTVNAVNERLREARRKTGVGSSRELARLVAAQENRHEQIGVAGQEISGVSHVPQASTPANRRWMMPLIASGGVAALALAVSLIALPARFPPAAQVEPAVDPLTPPDQRYSTTFDRELREVGWAAPMEASLAKRFGAVADLEGLEVRCASTLCRVSAWFPETTDGQRLNRIMRDLQGGPLTVDVEKLGLKHRTSRFGGLPGKGKRMQYLSYWTRMSLP